MGLGKSYYEHGSVKHSAGEYVDNMIHTNGIESMWALLKRGYTGTYHHFSLKHLQHYLNEFTFRLNEGNYEVDTMYCIAAICKGIHGKRIAYRNLVAEMKEHWVVKRADCTARDAFNMIAGQIKSAIHVFNDLATDKSNGKWFIAKHNGNTLRIFHAKTLAENKLNPKQCIVKDDG